MGCLRQGIAGLCRLRQTHRLSRQTQNCFEIRAGCLYNIRRGVLAIKSRQEGYMRKLAILLCLALAAGLFVSSCGRSGAAVPGNAVGFENVEISGGLRDVTDNQSQQKSGGSAGEDSAGTPSQDAPGLDSVDVDGLLAGARISGSHGSYTFSFHHPQVPDGLHLTVSLKVFRGEDGGDRLMFSYDSDGAWMSRPQDYDPSERDVKVPVEMKESLSDMYVMASAKVTDGDGGVRSAMAVRDEDGCMTEGFEDIFVWSGAQ